MPRQHRPLERKPETGTPLARTDQGMDLRVPAATCVQQAGARAGAASAKTEDGRFLRTRFRVLIRRLHPREFPDREGWGCLVNPLQDTVKP